MKRAFFLLFALGALGCQKNGSSLAEVVWGPPAKGRSTISSSPRQVSASPITKQSEKDERTWRAASYKGAERPSGP